MTLSNSFIRYSGFVLAIVCSFVLAPASHASTGLLDRVHEALITSGLPTTHATQQAYDVCIISGHYTTFTQLLNAMLWQKQHGHTVPDVTKCMDTNKVWKFTGTVTEVNKWKLETTGVNKQGVEILPKFNLTPHTIVKHGELLFDASDEMLNDVKNEIRRGSVVSVWATKSNEALIIQNLAPAGQGDYYGPVDCPSCQGSNDFAATPDAVIEHHCGD